MCLACVLTIAGGLLIAKKFGVNDVVIIGFLTIIFSIISDIILRKLNHGKVFFPYQRLIISFISLLIVKSIFSLLK